MPEELEDAAPKRVRPGPGRQVHHATVEAAKLGGRTVRLDLELLNGVDVRKEGDLTGFGLEDRNAVEQVFVGARPSPVDSRERRRGRWGHGHAWRQARERDEAPAVERQVDNFPVVDDVAKRRCFAAKERRVGRDRHRLRHTAECQLQIEAGRFAGDDSNALARQRPESAQFQAHPIQAGRQSREHIPAARLGHRQTRRVRSHRGDRHRHTRGGGAILIDHAANQRTGANLRAGRR